MVILRFLVMANVNASWRWSWFAYEKFFIDDEEHLLREKKEIVVGILDLIPSFLCTLINCEE